MSNIRATSEIIYNKIKVLSFLEYYLIICFFLIFASLGANLTSILNYKNINNIHNISNLRSLFPIIILFINSYYIFKKKIKVDKIEKIFIVLILSYFIGTLFNFENKNYFKISFLLNPLAFITTHIISKKNLNITYRLGIFIFFISAVLVLFYSQNKIGYGGGWINIIGNKFIFINSNGISRLICIANLLLLINLVFNKNYSDIKSIILILGIIILTTMVLISEGRVNIAIAFLSCFIIFLNKNVLFVKKFLLFLFIIFISFYLSKLYSNINANYSDINANYNSRFDVKLEKSLNDNIKSLLQSEQIFFDKEKNQEENWNRFNKWNLIVKEYSIMNVPKIIFGSGPEHDRILLREKGVLWNADAANGFLYSLLCGGVIGTILYLLILNKTIINLFFLIEKKIFSKKNYIDIFCVVCPLLIIIRSLFENSFSVWGIDFIVILISLSHIENEYY